MRTVEDLLKLEGRVYVYLESDEVREQFLDTLELAGFTFGDGAMPHTEGRDKAELYVLNSNRTIHFPGFVGTMAFYTKADTVGGEKLLRVDFRKFLEGKNDFLM